jgi:hypothetical protein
LPKDCEAIHLESAYIPDRQVLPDVGNTSRGISCGFEARTKAGFVDRAQTVHLFWSPLQRPSEIACPNHSQADCRQPLYVEPVPVLHRFHHDFIFEADRAQQRQACQPDEAVVLLLPNFAAAE